MSYTRLPIVGMFYGPQRGSPSQALVNALAIGTPLYLLAEPDNPADPNAVAVYVRSADIPEGAYDALRESLPPFGFDLDQILDGEAWHLGYVPKNFAAQLRLANVVPDDTRVDVSFATGTDGSPRVAFEEPVL